MTLDPLSAEQGGVCVLANSTCCTRINTSGKVETQLRKIPEQANLRQEGREMQEIS